MRENPRSNRGEAPVLVEDTGRRPRMEHEVEGGLDGTSLRLRDRVDNLGAPVDAVDQHRWGDLGADAGADELDHCAEPIGPFEHLDQLTVGAGEGGERTGCHVRASGGEQRVASGQWPTSCLGEQQEGVGVAFGDERIEAFDLGIEPGGVRCLQLCSKRRLERVARIGVGLGAAC